MRMRRRRPSEVHQEPSRKRFFVLVMLLLSLCWGRSIKDDNGLKAGDTLTGRGASGNDPLSSRLRPGFLFLHLLKGNLREP